MCCTRTHSDCRCNFRKIPLHLCIVYSAHTRIEKRIHNATYIIVIVRMRGEFSRYLVHTRTLLIIHCSLTHIHRQPNTHTHKHTREYAKTVIVVVWFDLVSIRAMTSTHDPTQIVTMSDRPRFSLTTRNAESIFGH